MRSQIAPQLGHAFTKSRLNHISVAEPVIVQSSCGMAVPLMDFQAQREDLSDHWRKNADLEGYWRRKNVTSLDGKPTRIFGD